MCFIPSTLIAKIPRVTRKTGIQSLADIRKLLSSKQPVPLCLSCWYINIWLPLSGRIRPYLTKLFHPTRPSPRYLQLWCTLATHLHTNLYAHSFFLECQLYEIPFLLVSFYLYFSFDIGVILQRFHNNINGINFHPSKRVCKDQEHGHLIRNLQKEKWKKIEIDTSNSSLLRLSKKGINQ